PYRFTRNPIYLAMVLGLIGLAIAFDSLWILATLVLFYLVIRYGVVAREEAYLERKFGGVYLGYKSPARRWLWGRTLPIGSRDAFCFSPYLHRDGEMVVSPAVLACRRSIVDEQPC